MSYVVYQTSDVRCDVRHLMSDVVYQTSDVRCGISDI